MVLLYVRPKQAEAMPNKLYAAWVTDKDASAPVYISYAGCHAIPSRCVRACDVDPCPTLSEF